MLELNYTRERKIISSRRIVKYICFIVSGAIIATYLLVSSYKSVQTVKKQSTEAVMKNSTTLVYEYSFLFDCFFNGIYAELNQLSKSATSINPQNKDQIFQWLKANNNLHFNKFSSIVYSDMDGNCFSSTGKTYKINSEYAFMHVKEENKDFSAVGPINIAELKADAIIFSAAIRSNNEKKGFIGALIDLATLKSFIVEKNIENQGSFFIIGDDNKYICHRYDEYLGQDCNKLDSNYHEHIKKAKTSKSLYSYTTKEYKTHAPIRVFLNPIETSGWICGIAIKESDMLKTHNYLINSIYTTSLITIAMSFLFTIISLAILNSRILWEKGYDELTGLWTRYKFEKEAQKKLDYTTNSNFVVIDMDFRGFKFINQGLGKDKADELLCQCADIILAQCKKIDFICGHGYADRFFAMGKISSVNSFMIKFEDFVTQMNKDLSNFPIPLYLKYGLTFVLPTKEFYNQRRTIQDLFGEATFAKEIVKKSVLKNYEVFTPKMQERILQDQRIERNMQRGLSSGEFVVYYQPKICLKDEKIKGAEALVRWNSANPNLGFLGPGEFISVFEKNGFIIQLDFEVYEMVFKFLRKQLDLGNPVVPISVNMARNHNDPNAFIDEFIKRFNKYNLPPNLIEVEILERSLEDNIFNLISITQKLHNHGFSVAMDDFGSGQSSLNMLSEIPVDVIKFDQNFLHNTNSNSEKDKMINVLIDLGKMLNKKTLFEGVETEEQRDMLKDLNCDQVQGYLYSKPLEEKDFVEFIKANI